MATVGNSKGSASTNLSESSNAVDKMRGSDRSSRLDEVMELLIGDAIVSPLSATEAINQLGEFTRNNGSFLRLLPQGLDKLARIAGEPMELGSLGVPAAAAE